MASGALDIALVHHLAPSGGAYRVLAEYVRARPQHAFTVYTRWPAPRPEDRLIALPESVVTRRFEDPEPATALGRLTALARLPRRGREMARAIDAAGHDVVFAHASLLTQSHETLPFLRTPSLAYAPETLRSAYEPHEPFGTPQNLRDRLAACGLDPYEALRKALDARQIRAATRVVTHSEFTRGALRDAYGVDAAVVPLGVAAADFAAPDPPPSRERLVLSVGALHARKGHQDVIEAVATIAAEARPEVVLVADRGEIEPALRALADARGVRLTVHRGLPFAALADLYRRAGVVAAAMIREPFGLTPLEAMAAGAPVVAVAEGGLLETVRDGQTGLLVPRDPQRLGAALRRVLDDCGLSARLARAGRREAATWTWERTAAGYDALLEGISSRSSGGTARRASRAAP